MNKLLLCPTLTQAGLAQFYGPRDGNNPSYQTDVAWFAQYKKPKRKFSVRAAIYPEFGLRMGSLLPPILWTLVIEFAPGFHLALPVWRGPQFFRVSTFKSLAFADVATDAEIAALLDEACQRGGIDQDAMMRWEAHVREASDAKFELATRTWGA